jgi:2'-5' RNA ligase
MDAQICTVLTTLIRELAASTADVRWVNPKHIHLTLKFLGSIRDEDVAQAAQIMDDSLKGIAPFEIEVKSLGAFPSVSSPRVIWAGCQETGANLEEIHKTLDERFASLGVNRETRKFHSHITLGRARSRRNIEPLTRDIADWSDLQIGTQVVDKILLMESRLRPTGAVYSVVHTCPLKAKIGGKG